MSARHTAGRTARYNPQGAPTVVYQLGALDQLGALLDEWQVSRAMIVTGRSLEAEGSVLRMVADRLGDRAVITFAGSRQHTSDESVLAGRDAFVDSGCDAVVSIGGGSAVDTAKGIALAAVVGDDLVPYRARVKRDAPGQPSLERGKLGGAGSGPSCRHDRVLVPHVAIPTTLSGAEYTDHAGITTAATGVKEQIYHQDLVPVAVILDPRATVATPVELWLSTGVKVLDHVVEIICSPFTSAASEALCLGSLRRVARQLVSSSDPEALEARAELQIAAWLAVAGYPNQMAGVGHAIGHQLGGLCGVPHGIGACCILPLAMEFNSKAAAEQLCLLAGELGGEHSPQAAVGAVRRLIRELQLPTRLREVGVPDSRLPEIAEQAFADEAIVGNPRIVESPAQILEEILAPAW
ncbi:MAG TPA: iron-containing alcohol dehydrogenase [Streptosporangiaceae bacterium]|nr:iron-containing alcohol dehydrogenase [Streptosporangiaceae bacterium]